MVKSGKIKVRPGSPAELFWSELSRPILIFAVALPVVSSLDVSSLFVLYGTAAGITMALFWPIVLLAGYLGLLLLDTRLASVALNSHNARLLMWSLELLLLNSLIIIVRYSVV